MPVNFQNRLASITQLGSDATAIAQAQAQARVQAQREAMAQQAQAKLDQSQMQAANKQAQFKASMDANTAALNQFAAQRPTSRTGMSQPSPSGTNYNSALSAPNAKRQAILNAAASQLGVAYSWGGGGTKGASKGIAQGANTVGFDCSGLVQYAYSKVGINLPRTSQQQGTVGVKTSLDKLQPGDLVAWNSGQHIAVYAGNGQIIEAPHTGAQVRTRAITAKERSLVHGVALSL